MSDVPLVGEVQPISFGARLAHSQLFTDLFCEGMQLLEKTAAYLDGPGRQESKKLKRSAALAYAIESMRLTTRVIQLASWLLLHRAVKDDEMSLDEARREKAKVNITAIDRHDPNNLELLPDKLRELIAASLEVQLRVCRIDETIHNQVSPDEPMRFNPVERQWGLLRAAFGSES